MKRLRRPELESFLDCPDCGVGMETNGPGSICCYCVIPLFVVYEGIKLLGR